MREKRRAFSRLFSLELLFRTDQGTNLELLKIAHTHTHTYVCTYAGVGEREVTKRFTHKKRPFLQLAQVNRPTTSFLDTQRETAGQGNLVTELFL